MAHNYSYKKLVYRIRHKNPIRDGLIYEENTVIGIFEFQSEENARRYVAEKNLKDVDIDEIIISTTESIRTL